LTLQDWARGVQFIQCGQQNPQCNAAQPSNRRSRPGLGSAQGNFAGEKPKQPAFLVKGKIWKYADFLSCRAVSDW